jgi:hypothetical protein
MITKISFDKSNYPKLQETCSVALIYRVSLNWFTHYNTYHKKLSPRYNYILAIVPSYKSIADIEDFGQMMPARQEPLCSCDRKLTYWYR